MYRQLKLSARKKLSGGNLSLCAGAVLISFMVFAGSGFLGYFAAGLLGNIPALENSGFFLTAANTAVSLTAALLLSPVLLGCFRIFFTAAIGERPLLLYLFTYMEKGLYRKALCFNFFLFIKLFLNFVLSFFALFAAVFVFAFFDLGNIIPPIVLVIIISLLTVLGVFLFLLFSASLAYAPLDFIRFPNAGALPHFRRSKNICQKHRFDILVLFISFIPWILLSWLVIPILWTAPYFFTAMITLCLALERQYSRGYSGQEPTGGSPYSSAYNL